MSNCELCELLKGKIITRLYYRTKNFLIVDCRTCGPNAPMIVCSEHTMNPSPELVERMKSKAHELFGDVTFREKQRKILSHYHVHILTLKTRA